MSANDDSLLPPVTSETPQMGQPSRMLLGVGRWINWVLGYAVGGMLLAMVALVFTQIVVRFVLPKLGLATSLPWTEEAARYLMVWVIFLGGAIAARRGLLIAVTALQEALPARSGRVLKDLALCVTAAFFLCLMWYGWRWAEFGADEVSPALTISKFWLYLSMPVGCLLAALNTGLVLIDRGEESKSGYSA